MLDIKFTKHAVKFLSKLPQKQALQLKQKISELRRNPFPHDSRALKGDLKARYRIDFGEYRIIYNTSDENLLNIMLVGKRNDSEVYKKARNIQ